MATILPLLLTLFGAFMLHSATAKPHYPGHHGGMPNKPHFPGHGWTKVTKPPQDPAVLDPTKLTRRERECYDILMAIENGNLTAFDVDNPDHYIQHNPNIPDNKEGLIEFVKQGLGTSKVKVIRMYEDGDYVFAHTRYTFGPQAFVVAGYDVWRYDELNLIAEHWDNLQPLPSGSNPSGRTLLDGPFRPSDLHKTAENKALVTAYAFSHINGRLRTDLLASNLIQHHPTIGDGVAALTKGLAAQGKGLTYKSLFTVMGKGNFVLVMAPGTEGTTPVGLYDMYRVEKGKIVEQWPIVETIPPRELWVNPNGKFNGF